MTLGSVRPLRIIRLRRPPVFAALSGRFVPSQVTLQEIDACWEALCRSNGKLVDGGILQVLGTSRNGHGGVSMHVQECAYRFFAVQASGLNCGVRPLGVKGIVSVGSKYLVGKRSTLVGSYQGSWEFVPGGGLEQASDPVAGLRGEFEEEVGFALPADITPIAIALLDDTIARSWDIIYRVRLTGECVCTPSFEHDSLRLLSLEELRALDNSSPAMGAMLSLLPRSSSER